MRKMGYLVFMNWQMENDYYKNTMKLRKLIITSTHTKMANGVYTKQAFRKSTKNKTNKRKW